MSKPLGWWECTHSTFKDFKVGEKYLCKLDKTGGPRIYPYEGSLWAPYWSEYAGTFCYPTSELNFKYIGSPLDYATPKATLTFSVTCEYQPDVVYVNGRMYITGTPK